MRNLENITARYLSKETDYATQISGNWGAGKTHFYRNTLDGLIAKTATHFDSSKKYIPVYISLFGVSSIDDIETKIVIEFYQSTYFKGFFKKHSKKKVIKVTGGIVKLGFRGFIGINRLGNANEYKTEIKNIAQDVLDPKQLVICFDDLERRNRMLQIEDLIGYINNLVDQGVKVLLIANQDKLVEHDKEVYKALKEKVIGITMEYIPEDAKVIQNIIKTKYSGFKEYSNYLNENFDQLVAFAKFINHNYRTLIYCLDCFHDIYSIIHKNIFDTKHEITKSLKEHLKTISFMSIAIAAEYKNTEISPGNIHELQSFDFSAEFFGHGDIEKAEKARSELFKEKYNIKIGEYHIFDSIINFIIGVDEFRSDEFIAEFVSKFSLTKGVVTTQYQLFNELSVSNFLDLSDKDYEEKTKKILDYGYKGEIKVEHYFNLMDCAERLDNILKLDLEEVRINLIEGIKKSMLDKNLNPDPYFRQFFINGNWDVLKGNKKIIFEEAKKVINESINNTIIENFKKGIDLFLNKKLEFDKLYNSDQTFRREFNEGRFFKYVDHPSLLNYVKEQDSNGIDYLKFVIKNSYEDMRKVEQDAEQIDQFTALLSAHCEKDLSSGNTKIRWTIIQGLINYIERIKRFAS